MSIYTIALLILFAPLLLAVGRMLFTLAFIIIAGLADLILLGIDAVVAFIRRLL